MSEGENVLRVVLIVSDGAAHEDAFHAAVALSARLSASLEALFVEDEDVLRAASLPAGAQLVSHGRTGGPLVAEDVLSAWRALADRARGSILQEAARLQVPAQFRVARKTRKEQLERVGEGGELVMYARARPPRTPFGRPASSFAPEAPVCVWIEPEGDLEKALGIGLALANASHPLELWASGFASDALRELEVRAARLAGRKLKVRLLGPMSFTRDNVLRTLRAAEGGVLVLPDASVFASTLRGLTQESALPCWIVLTS